MKNKNEFKKSFKNNITKYRFALIVVPAVGLLVFPLVDVSLAIKSYVIIFILPYLFVYLKSVDFCMIKKVRASNLTEGDWLESSVKVGGKVIRKSVHGLSWEDILLLRKYNKSVIIKEGIPFVPVFLIALMVFFYLISRSDVILSFSLF